MIVPPTPITQWSGSAAHGVWNAAVSAKAGFVYELERTEDFVQWTTVAGPEPGTEATLILQDTTSPPGMAFYRVRADKP